MFVSPGDRSGRSRSSVLIFSKPYRELFLTDRRYYVRTNGNDANTGTGPGNAWLTLTHAAAFLADRTDFNGKSVIVDIGPGTFQGFGTRQCMGAGFLGFFGAGSSLTTIEPGDNDGNYNTGENMATWNHGDVAFGINKVRLLRTGSGGGTGVLASSPAGVSIGDWDFSSGDVVYEGKGSVAQCVAGYLALPSGPITYKYTGAVSASAGALVSARQTAVYVENFAQYTFVPSPNDFPHYFNGSFQATTQSQIILRNGYTTFTGFGNAEGLRHLVTSGALITVEGAGTSFLPGNTDGIEAEGGLFLP